MAKKEYENLVKPMVIKAPPKGLYAEPRIWMEAKDLEGFDAHFSYGFVKKPSTFHPLEGALVHPYDEILVFEGTDNTNILYLGAEVSIELGEEHEEHVFKEPSAVIIPKGTPHGPVTVKKLDRPIVHYSIGLAAEYRAAAAPGKPKTKGSKHGHLVKRMITNFDSMGRAGSDRLSADQYGVIKAVEMGVGPGNGDEVVWLYGDDLEGFNVNFTWGLYSKCGKWHRGGEGHYHPEAEILCFVGLDPDKLDFLGAELELGMGKDYERHIFNTPTVAICPAAFPHLPLITRWVDKPYGFIVVCLSGEHASPWVEA
ncbi:MAG TPA: hypothetical protein VMW86_00735 [Dehalococcoidales bacterium]|nr:hypothetical protein [Dehalococcoidales bacterium]